MTAGSASVDTTYFRDSFLRHIFRQLPDLQAEHERQPSEETKPLERKSEYRSHVDRFVWGRIPEHMARGEYRILLMLHEDHLNCKECDYLSPETMFALEGAIGPAAMKAIDNYVSLLKNSEKGSWHYCICLQDLCRIEKNGKLPQSVRDTVRIKLRETGIDLRAEIEAARMKKHPLIAKIRKIHLHQVALTAGKAAIF